MTTTCISFPDIVTHGLTGSLTDPGQKDEIQKNVTITNQGDAKHENLRASQVECLHHKHCTHIPHN